MRFFVFRPIFALLPVLLPGAALSATDEFASSDAEVVIVASASSGGSGLIRSNVQREKAEALNDLFDELARQAKPSAANRTAKQIWQYWTASGSDSIDLLMGRVSVSMKADQNQIALDLLAQFISLAPDYAEAWNRRATLYFTMKEFGRSISDIEQVLKLEPRHFGALSGLAVILQGIGRDRKALETWYRVLEIYPANEQAQKAVIKLEDKLAGNPT